AVQGYQDRQTQELPTAETARASLALVMGCADWPAFQTELDGHRERVGTHFGNVIAVPDDESQNDRFPELAQWRNFWSDGDLSVEAAAEQLAQHGHEDAAEMARLLLTLRGSALVKRMQPQARTRLDEFMPQLLRSVAAAERP